MTSKYDFNLADKRYSAYTSNGKLQPFGFQDDFPFTHKTIKAALSILARVQSGELAVVPVVSTLDSRVAGLKYAENVKHWDWIAVDEFCDVLIKAAPTIEELMEGGE